MIDLAPEREMAHIETVDRVDPIKGADAIELATIGGWRSVVKKGSVVPGQPVLYVEIDAAVPVDHPMFDFLQARKSHEGRNYHILRTVRLRGELSQGLVVPIPAGFSQQDILALGIGKWEPEMAATASGQTAGTFLTQYAHKSDSPRVQNLAGIWDELVKFKWLATEKLDGSSTTVIRDMEDRVRVCSRNQEVKMGDNVYWLAALDVFGLAGHEPKVLQTDCPLLPGQAVQLEAVGPGIQGNPLSLRRVEGFAFDYFVNGTRVWEVHEEIEECVKTAPPVDLNMVLPPTVHAAVACADGMTSRITQGRLAEGIVWHCADPEVSTLRGMGNRFSVKAISNAYLERAK